MQKGCTLKSLTRADTFQKYKIEAEEAKNCLQSARTSKKKKKRKCKQGQIYCQRLMFLLYIHFSFHCICLIIFSLLKRNCKGFMFVSTCLHNTNASGKQRGHATTQDNKDKQILLAELIHYYWYLRFCMLLLILIHVDMLS